MKTRRRFKQAQSLKDRLGSFAKNVMDKASRMPAGHEQNELLRKARQAEVAAHLDEWINSPGLQQPK